MSESFTRAISGLVYVVLLIAMTLFSKISFLILFAFFLIMLIVEFCDLIKLNKFLALSIGLVLYFLFAFFDIPKKTNFFLIIATLYVSTKLIYLLFSKSVLKIDAFTKCIYLIGYIVLPIIILTKIPTDILEQKFQPQIIVSIFTLIWINDTFAYIVGKSIGKNKLFESISPKKTIEGFLGGVFFAVIFSVIIAKYFLEKPVYIWFIIAILVGVFGTLGDLVESKFKRTANVKDSGTIMPGHGGILDRLDSVIFVAPFIFLFLQIIQYFIHD